MIVVLPFFSGDAGLAAKNLEWMIQLDGKVPYECILSCDTKTSAAEFAGVTTLAEKLFSRVHQFRYNRHQNSAWPFPQNKAFTDVAHMMPHRFPKQSFLWVETDAVPMRPGWIQAIEECHVKNGKPFTGHWNEQTKVFNGVAVYPSNISRYSTNALTATLIEGKQPPWDVFCSRQVEKFLNKSNHLFQHIWQNDATGQAWTFSDAATVARVVREGVVLFHRCKDGSLIDVLRGQAPAIVEARQKKQDENTIVVQRTASIGDCISASVVADKLKQKGFNVKFAADPAASIPLKETQTLIKPGGYCDVNLDGAYENHPERKHKHRNHIFIDVANQQLSLRGIRLDYANATPEIQWAPKLHFVSKSPNIVVVPRSNSFINRTVPRDVWAEVAASAPQYSWYWSGTDDAPAGFNDLKYGTLPDVMTAIAGADLVVSVDTGPLHIATALGKPIVAIAQSTAPELVLTDQVDFSVVSASLGCINCQLPTCPIDTNAPPCGNLHAGDILRSVQEKWQAVNGSKVSAVIAIYKPNVERLNKCLTHVLPQVDEVVVTVDGDGAIPSGVVQSNRIRWVQNPTGERQGFGKTVNRAIRQSSGRFILLLNDDVYLRPDAVRHMKAAMDDNTAIVGCRLWYPDGTIQHGGGYRNPGDIGWGHLDVKKKIPTIRKRTELEFVTGAAMLIRREAFYQAGAFNELYDCYCEDTELCLQVRKNGWKIMFEPNAEGIHDESQTTGPMKKELGKTSYAIFRERWKWYFDKNRDSQMGAFV